MTAGMPGRLVGTGVSATGLPSNSTSAGSAGPRHTSSTRTRAQRPSYPVVSTVPTKTIGATAYGLAGGLPELTHEVAPAELAHERAPANTTTQTSQRPAPIIPKSSLPFQGRFPRAALLSLASRLLWLGGIRDTRHLAHQP